MEWATDIVFRNPEFLKRLMRLMVRHAVESFSCTYVLRYFGKRVTKSGEVPDRFNGELKSNLKQYREGERVKFWMQAIPPSSTTRRIPPLATFCEQGKP
jgi:hypothetical protein